MNRASHKHLAELAREPIWDAATTALGAYDRCLHARRLHLLQIEELLKTEPSYRQRLTRTMGSHDLLAVATVEAGQLYPGHALPFALQLLAHNPDTTAREIQPAVEAVFPELTHTCRHQPHSTGLPAREAALCGCHPCGDALGGRPVLNPN